MQACLADAEVKALLDQHYVVVNDPTDDNKTSTGVLIWVLTDDNKEIRNYSWGGGICLIGNIYTETHHRRRCKDMVRVLTEARQIAAGELQAAEVLVGAIQSVDAERKTIMLKTREVMKGHGAQNYGADIAKGGRKVELKLSADTKITRCTYHIHWKDATNSPGDLKSRLTGADVQEVKVMTTTDMKGIVTVHEIQLRINPLLRR